MALLCPKGSDTAWSDWLIEKCSYLLATWSTLGGRRTWQASLLKLASVQISRPDDLTLRGLRLEFYRLIVVHADDKARKQRLRKLKSPFVGG